MAQSRETADANYGYAAHNTPMKTPLYNLENAKIGEIELPDQLFNRPWNADLVEQAIRVQTANRRRPLAHAKGRGEVRGGGRKPWRQKGTGRARQGSIRSPLWRGGGVSHGPTKERSFALSLNKKMRRAALASALSRKLRDEELKIVRALPGDIQKTKELARALKPFLPSILLVPSAENKLIYRASANLPKVKALHPTSLNVEDILKYRHILLDEKAVAHIRTASHG